MTTSKAPKTYYQLSYKSGISAIIPFFLTFSTLEAARTVAKDLKKQVLDLELWECTESSPMINRTKLPL